MELPNMGLALLANIIFVFPISSSLYEMVKVFKEDVKYQKKGSIRWLVFFVLVSLTMWFYLVYSSLFRWQF